VGVEVAVVGGKKADANPKVEEQSNK